MKVSVEWSDASSQSHHPFLISNLHTGIFMRGRENITVSLHNLGPSFSLQSTDRPTKAEARGACPGFLPASRGVSRQSTPFDLLPSLDFLQHTHETRSKSLGDDMSSLDIDCAVLDILSYLCSSSCFPVLRLG
jgi:hypothetical protein